MSDVAKRVRGRVQLTTDGHKAYLWAVEGAFGLDVDYATLTKIYGKSEGDEKRYSPAQCLGCETKVVTPAMEAGVTDRVWSVEEIVGLLE